MNDDQIETLKSHLMADDQLVWNPDTTTCRKIIKIGKGPNVDPCDEPEPSECAYFSNGEYVALYNCEPYQFKILITIFT